MSYLEATAPKRSLFKAACRAVFSWPMFARFRSRSARRRLVVAFLLVMIAFPITGWLSVAEWPVLALLVPYGFLALALSASTNGILDRPIRSLDERERQQRVETVPEPYVVGASLGLAAGLFMMLATRLEDPLAIGVMLALVGLLYGLPSLKLAWAIDEPDDDH